MTRRERHLRIIESFDDREQHYHRVGMLAAMEHDAFTDAAIEEWARRLITAHKRRERDRAAVDRFFAAQRTA